MLRTLLLRRTPGRAVARRVGWRKAIATWGKSPLTLRASRLRLISVLRGRLVTQSEAGFRVRV